MTDEPQTNEQRYREALKEAWENFNSVARTDEKHASAYTRAFAQNCADDIRHLLASIPTDSPSKTGADPA